MHCYCNIQLIWFRSSKLKLELVAGENHIFVFTSEVGITGKYQEIHQASRPNYIIWIIWRGIMDNFITEAAFGSIRLPLSCVVVGGASLT